MRIPEIRSKRLQLLRGVQDGHPFGCRKPPELSFGLREYTTAHGISINIAKLLSPRRRLPPLLRRGETEPGAVYLKQALEIFQRMAMQPDADRVQIRLVSLTNPQNQAGHH